MENNLDKKIEIVRAIRQAAANAYDGSGKETGLKRDNSSYPNDLSRDIDNFNVRVSKNRMILNYQVECSIKEIHSMGMEKFKGEIENMFKSLVKYLTKEANSLTKERISLTKDCDLEIDIENISNIRTTVKAWCEYKIAGMEDNNSEEKKYWKDKEEAIKKFTMQLKEGARNKRLSHDSFYAKKRRQEW